MNTVEQKSASSISESALVAKALKEVCAGDVGRLVGFSVVDWRFVPKSKETKTQ